VLRVYMMFLKMLFYLLHTDNTRHVLERHWGHFLLQFLPARFTAPEALSLGGAQVFPYATNFDPTPPPLSSEEFPG